MSEMTKHTLPPWRVNGTNVFQDNALGSVVMIASCGGSVLTYEERKANARLIGVAPETAAERDRLRELNSDLLAALRASNQEIKLNLSFIYDRLKTFELLEHKCLEVRQIEKIIADNEDAILKAEGEPAAQHGTGGD